MSSYETLKSKLLQSAPASVPAGALVFLASALSVVVSSAVRAPLDLIKVQMQSGAVSSAGGALSAAWGSGGIRGVGRLYKGAGLGLMRDVPFFGINLLVYEQLRAAALVRAQARVLSDGGRAELSTMDLIIIGAVAQGLAGWLTNPFDLLKTRVQSGVAANVGAAFRSVLLEGGPAALMRGAGMRVFWIAPQGCVYFPAYELTLRCLGR
ncbi:mitochondrial carrier [Chrysochromulina tobinii]|uniref:Mitochondrial carrier n=1 Tax=Chrysochromulina tobinii TaxID=1460289 RepID=A0A0M0JZ88_9EUKA|nr:mitochondrial carrier [Chrysochromulina tobinii]|eukprot:KOO31642.1 mitochondrial carrier [Chrysochromulina sp. CCMP291]